MADNPVPLVLSIVSAIAVHVWIAASLQAVFRKAGEEGWQAWVPILNAAVLLRLGGLSPLWVLALLVPVLGLLPIWVACHRVNASFGAGGGMTVLAVLVFPVWSSILGWGSATWLGREKQHRAPAWVAGTSTLDARVSGAPVVGRPPATHGFTAVPPLPPAASPYASPPPVSPYASPPPVPPVLPQTPVARQSPNGTPAPLNPNGSPAPPWSHAADNPPHLTHAPSWTAGDDDDLDDAPRRRSTAQVEPDPVAAPARHAADAGNAPDLTPPRPARSDEPVDDDTEGAAALRRAPGPAARPSAPADQSAWAPPASVERPADRGPRYSPMLTDAFSDTSAEVSAVAGAPGVGGPMSARSSVSSQRGEPEIPDAANPFDETIIATRKRTAFMLTPPLGAPIAVTSQVLIVGRRPSSDPDYPHAQLVPIADETRTMSKTHARLELGADGWSIVDLDSTNGVVLLRPDGGEHELDPGRPQPVTERFLLGDAELRLTRERDPE